MSRIVITYSERVENHAGMQILGTSTPSGISYDTLLRYHQEHPTETVFHDISVPDYPACVIVLPKFIQKLFPNSDHFEELKNLPWDKQAFMRGRVVNKIARYNLCFGKEYQQADFEAKKGTVIPMSTTSFMDTTAKFFEREFNLPPLLAEGNYYYNRNCYIGWHGDGERRIVIGVSYGDTMYLKYNWYVQCQQWSPEEYVIELNDGDVYIMSEKAVGHDWKKQNIPTLRHCATFDR